jgi:hypothetical protein
MVDVNPDMPEENVQYNPIDHVTGVFGASQASAVTVIQALEAAGFARGDIDLFIGDEGERKLDPGGDESMGARIFRTLESWVSDTAGFQDTVVTALDRGGYVIAVLVGDDEAKKDRAIDVLKAQDAESVKYWHSLFTEDATRAD